MGASIDTSAVTKAYLRALNPAAGFFAAFDFPFSISCWVKHAAFFGEEAAVGLNRGNTNSHWHMLATQVGSTANDGSARVKSTAAGTNSQGTTAEETGINDTWVHLVGVWTSATSRIAYLNGVASVEDATSVNPTTIDSMTIGASAELAGAFGVFDIAELGIWNVALSSGNVTTLMTSTPGASGISGLQHYWPLSDDLGDDVGTITLEDVNANVTLSAANHPSFATQTGFNPAWAQGSTILIRRI